MAAKRPPWIEQRISPHIMSIPPYVPGKPVAELAREFGIPDAIKMASNENPLGPAPLAIRLWRPTCSSLMCIRSRLPRSFEPPLPLGSGCHRIRLYWATVLTK